MTLQQKQINDKQVVIPLIQKKETKDNEEEEEETGPLPYCSNGKNLLDFFQIVSWELCHIFQAHGHLWFHGDLQDHSINNQLLEK